MENLMYLSEKLRERVEISDVNPSFTIDGLLRNPDIEAYSSVNHVKIDNPTVFQGDSEKELLFYDELFSSFAGRYGLSVRVKNNKYSFFAFCEKRGQLFYEKIDDALFKMIFRGETVEMIKKVNEQLAMKAKEAGLDEDLSGIFMVPFNDYYLTCNILNNFTNGFSDDVVRKKFDRTLSQYYLLINANNDIFGEDIVNYYLDNRTFGIGIGQDLVLKKAVNKFLNFQSKFQSGFESVTKQRDLHRKMLDNILN